MQDRFLSYLEDLNITRTGKTLVAASAGLDSTVLCHLYHAASIPFAIAHCNFSLRGKESDKDEAFIKEFAANIGVPFYSVRFDTENYALENGTGIQEAARELRYRWLEQIRLESNSQLIATAHHIDDNIETILFNFTKGCGIKGIRGILPVSGRLIRPLLFASKEEIGNYAREEGITYREDESNLSDKYTRNRIRNKVTPVLESINPSFQASAGSTIRRLQEAEQLYHFAVQLIRRQVMQTSPAKDTLTIDFEKLLSYPAPSTVLYELLKSYGFNNTQTAQMLESADNQPGGQYESEDYRVIKDRSRLILKSKENVEGVKIIYSINDSPVSCHHHSLEFELIDSRPESFPSGPDIALIDYDRLHWPLTLRPWQPGDVFQPLGMDGKRKKLQDFFTDRKMSLFEKEDARILESGGEICWIAGMRIDERFKVTEHTSRCLVLKWLDR